MCIEKKNLRAPDLKNDIFETECTQYVRVFLEGGTFNLRNRRGTAVVVVKIETLCWNRTIGTKLKMLLFLARVGKHRSTSRWVDITAWQRFMNSRRIVLPAFIFLFMTNRTFAVYHRPFAHAPSLSLRPTFFFHSFVRSFTRSLVRSVVRCTSQFTIAFSRYPFFGGDLRDAKYARFDFTKT